MAAKIRKTEPIAQLCGIKSQDEANLIAKKLFEIAQQGDPEGKNFLTINSDTNSITVNLTQINNRQWKSLEKVGITREALTQIAGRDKKLTYEDYCRDAKQAALQRRLLNIAKVYTVEALKALNPEQLKALTDEERLKYAQAIDHSSLSDIKKLQLVAEKLDDTYEVSEKRKAELRQQAQTIYDLIMSDPDLKYFNFLSGTNELTEEQLQTAAKKILKLLEDKFNTPHSSLVFYAGEGNFGEYIRMTQTIGINIPEFIESAKSDDKIFRQLGSLANYVSAIVHEFMHRQDDVARRSLDYVPQISDRWDELETPKLANFNPRHREIYFLESELKMRLQN